MELPSSLHWCHHIVPTLDNGGREVTDLVNIVEKIVVFGKPASVYEIVTNESHAHKRYCDITKAHIIVFITV